MAARADDWLSCASYRAKHTVWAQPGAGWARLIVNVTHAKNSNSALHGVCAVNDAERLSGRANDLARQRVPRARLRWAERLASARSAISVGGHIRGFESFEAASSRSVHTRLIIVEPLLASCARSTLDHAWDAKNVVACGGWQLICSRALI